MALVVFLRGVNVGGHKTFRPSAVAKTLSAYGVVNVGAAGTFVVRKPGSRAQFLTALRKALPFATEIVLCDGREVLRLETEHPFPAEPVAPDIVRFVTILSQGARATARLPVAFPPEGDWLLRVFARQGQFVFGTYRRHMKTIGYLGKLDKLFNAPATTRNWNTIATLIRILKD